MRPGVDVKVPIGIVFQAADGSVPTEEGPRRAHVASHTEIDGVAGQVVRAWSAADAGVVLPAAAR
jgi:hypothetical protein